ncbi:uncharacterized protein LOC107848997 isoform X3 [Capsicum annuum]|uniref:uncharacterized protein LOC107848997 isoform X3 n=1 Tax=Capsicum annuum TaxID=4072 RepID=UPI001FB0AAC4|nr:uncharacterized protein LOC107848997 isoform X3 [Capsicum annuum]
MVLHFMQCMLEEDYTCKWCLSMPQLQQRLQVSFGENLIEDESELKDGVSKELSTQKSANNDNGSETEDENIEIPGKYQQAEVDDDDSDLLEEDNQTEVNFDEEGNIVKKKLHNFISPTLIQPVTSANDISNHQKKGKEVNTLLPLDEPLDASTPNKALDDILDDQGVQDFSNFKQMNLLFLLPALWMV